MVTVSERIVSIGVSGDPADVTAIVDKIKFKHPHARRILSHALHKRTGGEQGWDGYVKPLKKTDPDHAEALRGYKPKIMAAIEELGIELDPESRILDSPFKHVTSADIPDDIIKSDFPLDENQREIIAAWLQHGMGIGKIAVNGGKTAAFAGFAAMLRSLADHVRILYITDRERLTTQVDKEMKRFLPGWHITKFGGGSCDESGEDMVICTLAMLRQHAQDLKTTGWFNTFHAIMFDECFVAGTLVDGRPIETLRVGDKVWSVNSAGEVEQKSIIRLFKKKPVALVKVTINGKVTVCTANHPIFVYGSGFVRADSLSPGSEVVVSTMLPSSYQHGSSVPLVQNIVHATKEVADKLCSLRETPLLPARVRESVCKSSIVENGVRDESKICFRTNEAKQSDVDSRSERTSDHENTVLQQATPSSCGERALHSSPNAAMVEPWGRVDYGTSSVNENQTRQRKANSFLQSGFGKSEFEAGCGSGRPFPLLEKAETDRCLEDCTLTRGRVDSVEVLEPGSDSGFGEVCPGGYVYNLEVEGNHTYFANGVLVHNCHHAASESAEMLLQEFKGAFFRVAASDTIKFGDPLKHDKIVGLCGPVLMTVHQDELIEAGRSAVPHIYLIDPEDWKGTMENVPYRPDPDTKAWVLLDGEEAMSRGTYVGPVYERDDKGEVKMKKSKVLNGIKIESVEVPVTKPGLHTIAIDGVEYEIDSSYCLLERSVDRCIVNNKERNELIAEWVKYFSVEKNKRTLVVATRTVHVLILEALLTSTEGIEPDKVMTLIGEDSPARRNKAFAWFKRTPGAILITPLVKEGVSINEIEAGVIADYVGDWEYANQIIGRFIRKKEDENVAEIAWFIDRQQKRFEKGCLGMFKRLQEVKGYLYYWPLEKPSDIDRVEPSDTTAVLEAKDRSQRRLAL